MELPKQDERDIELGNSLFYFLILISKLGLSKHADMLLTNPVDMVKFEDFLKRHRMKTEKILIL